MSEGNVPPRPNDSDSLDSAARADQTPANPSVNAPNYNDWEIVPLVGMPPLGDDLDVTASQPSPRSREAELQARIQDLNHCNEVLLSRVHQLEEALERSQHALQQEVERSQRMTEEEKVAAAQSHSVAQLLTELEQSNTALERQTILAETLQAQLQTFQDRSKQLESECVLLRKRNNENKQQLQAAEETCADLRSRLQRQQRYTLQFKAALEKCLDTSAFKHTTSNIETAPPSESSFIPEPTPSVSSSVNPLVMPRSERIQPWSASGNATPTDPQLLSLMRSQPLNSNPEADSVAVSSPLSTDDGTDAVTVSPPEAAIVEEPVTSQGNDVTQEDSRAAEQKLWHDVERVIDRTAADESSPSAPPPPQPAPTATQFTEPIPWGAPIQKATAELTTESDSQPADVDDAPQADKPKRANTEQRSPSEAESVPPHRPPSVPDEYRQSSFAVSVPALDAMKIPQSSPSPVVHPLKPTQRKRKSLSAVELPSFPPLPKVEN